MNLFSFSILFFLIMVVAFGQRRWAAIGMIAGALYLTQGAKIEIFGINFFAMRFLELAGFVRVMARKEFSFSKLNKIDQAFLWLYFYTTVVFLLRSNEGLTYQIGVAADSILCYFSFRGLIREVTDLRWFLRTFVVLLTPYVALVLTESLSQQNFFGLVGGVSQVSMFRHGRLRCMGSFRHPDLLGTLGASFLPLYIGLACYKADRIQGFLGLFFCALIVWLTNSGGPVAAAAAGLVGWSIWYFRMKMFFVRRSIVALILSLAVIMKAPIWYLPSKVSSIVGGGGYHRSYLMDIAFKNLSKWWLIGMPFMETRDWFPYRLAATGAADITNQYLSFGIRAGLGAIILFIHLLVQSFRSIGRTISATHFRARDNANTDYFLWGLGVALWVHIVNWLGVSYFDQSYVVWLMQLAAISSLTTLESK